MQFITVPTIRKKSKNAHSKFRQGLFTPNNPHKYMGDTTNIVYRSSWEMKMFRKLDNDERILGWNSESIVIPYMKPIVINGKPALKPARYFPDLYVEYVDRMGKFRRQLIEIKPERQTKPSTSRKPKIKLYENMVYAVNSAKFSAAKAWCDEHDIEFVVATEKSLFRT